MFKKNARTIEQRGRRMEGEDRQPPPHKTSPLGAIMGLPPNIVANNVEGQT